MLFEEDLVTAAELQRNSSYFRCVLKYMVHAFLTSGNLVSHNFIL